MAERANAHQLWMGTLEVRHAGGRSEILGDAKGAFVDVVTWASNADEYRRKAELIIDHLGQLFIADVLNPEPVDLRRAKLHG